MSKSILRAAALVCAAMLVLAGCGGSTTGSKSFDDHGGQLKLAPAEIKAHAPTDVPKGTKYVITVNLEPGVKWSDGTTLTAQDFVGLYDVKWAQQDPLWQSLTDVKAPSDTQLVFETKDLSPNLMQQLIRWNQPGSSSQYGDVYKSLARLRGQGAAPGDAKVAAVLKRLDAMKPAKPVAYGPYVIDPRSVTAQQMEMVKNPGGFNADKIKFGHVDVAWGQTQQTVPLILKNELDYTTDALTPTDVRAVEANPNIELIRTPLSTGTGVWFNEAKKPFDDKRFRQAIALIIDRKRNATVSLGSAAKPVKYMVGFSDNYVPDWLSGDVVAKLNTYERDPAAAARLLQQVGLSKDGSNWTYHGKPFGFEIIAPADFPDFLASAKDVSAQLNEFGFDTHVRGIPAANRPDTIKQGRYDVMLDFSMVSTPSTPRRASTGTWPRASSARTTRRPRAPRASTGRGTSRLRTARRCTSPICSRRRSRVSTRGRRRGPSRRWPRSSTTNCR